MSFRSRVLLPICAFAATVSLTGCWTMADAWETPEKYVPSYLQPYRSAVHQGNLVTSEMVAQLEKGMTAPQVQFLLGVPLVQDQFHHRQWDYVYYLRSPNGSQQLRRLTVFFNRDDRLDHWTSDAMPDEEQADQLILGTIREFSPKDTSPTTRK